MANKYWIMRIAKKIGPHLFSRFDFIVYNQSDRQAKFI